MPSKFDPGRIAVILVRARNPNNIGAVARAMHDFGYSDLRIVNDFAMPLEGARSAVDAASVLYTASTWATVADAVADCTVVVGTTAVGERDLMHPLLTLQAAAPQILKTISDGATPAKVAILFGSEKTGLSNEELSHCNFLLTIPMFDHADSRHLSMNLGQAVAVCLYELVREPASESDFARQVDDAKAASAGEQERLTMLLSELLEESEYTRHHPANSSLADIRRLVRRLRLASSDVPVWMGIFRQLLWKMRH